MKNSYFNLLKKSPQVVSYGVIHYFFSSVGQSFFLSLFIPQFCTRLAIDAATFAYIYAVSSFAAGVLLSVIGPVVDRIDLRKCSGLFALLAACFCLLMGQVQSVWMLGIAIFGLRLTGQGMMPLIGAAAMGKYFKADRGKALSIAALGMSVGEVLAPIGLVVLINTFEWTTLWSALAVIQAVVFPFIAYLLVGKVDLFATIATTAQSKGSSKKFIRELLRSPSYWLYAVSLVFCPFLAAGIMIHHSSLLEIKSWSLPMYATGFVGFGVARILSSISTGPLIDRWSASRLLPYFLWPIIMMMACLIFVKQVWVLYLLLFVLGGSLSFGSICGTALWAEIYGAERMGTAKSLNSTLMVFACSMAPIIFVSVFTTAYLFVAMAGLIMLAIVLSLLTRFSLARNSATNQMKAKKATC
ncbi:MFS transporter [Persicobacter psychrovividus]|uniref:Major facilitator superfamily (MFS) profile domain-containing protein n=1 Tax=Persicobacter psychrovividus TaxID=387638 RepID=A0ABM7VL29_9BACT|nr:hypothetical protein PEPS_38670 [Persicobacter psychrovividus]